MVQYERELKRKIQSIIYEANTRGVVNEIALGQCEAKRKLTEDKLNNLRVKLAILLQKLQLVGNAILSSRNIPCGKSIQPASFFDIVIHLLALDESFNPALILRVRILKLYINEF